MTGTGGCCRHTLCTSHVWCYCVSMCKQVPVPSLPAGVHESGKSVEKADAIFSQERDPRFAEMFAGISACECLGTQC